MKIRRDIFSFRNRVVVIVAGILLGSLSLLFTDRMARRLKVREQHDVELWAHALERANRNGLTGDLLTGGDPLIDYIVDSRNDIPFVITDENLNALRTHPSLARRASPSAAPLCPLARTCKL